MKNLTFEEKILWISLIATIIVYGVYYINALPPIDGNMETAHIYQFFTYLGLLIAIVIIGFISLLVKNKEKPFDDERQKFIEMKAAKNSYFLLHIGVIVSIIVAMIIPGNFWFIHTINFFAVLTETLHIILQLKGFRKAS